MKLLRPGLPLQPLMATTQALPGVCSSAAAAAASQQKQAACLPEHRHQAGLAAAPDPLPAPDCTLGALYEVVRGTQQQQLQEGLSPAQVQHICHIIENIKLEDLGLNPLLGQAMTYGSASTARELRARLRPKGSRATVTYLDIHDDAAMTIGIFQLPPGARMPLHDHPGMTVFSRLLYGTLHVRAYDWVGGSGSDAQQQQRQRAGGGDVSMGGCGSDGGCDSPGGSPSRSSSSSGCSHHSSATGEFGLGPALQPARLVTDRVLTAPADTMVLFPSSGGNIHAFTAISPCAILDVLTPPYGNRNCTYYREVFPPQWMDGAGQPVLVPSEDVASWVAWQAAGAAQPPQQQQQAQQHPGSGSGSSGGGSGPPSVEYPSAMGVGEGGRQDIIVGLEVWKEPADFHVARGTYAGQRVL